MLALAAWLPTPVIDELLASMFGMTRKQVKISRCEGPSSAPAARLEQPAR